MKFASEIFEVPESVLTVAVDHNAVQTLSVLQAITDQLVFALKVTREIQSISTKVAQLKEKFQFLKVVMRLHVEEMKSVKLELKAQFVIVKIVTFGIRSHQRVKNHLYHNALNQLTVNKMKLVDLTFLEFSNASQFVQRSIAQHFLFVSQEIMREVVNVCQAIKEIQMTAMDVRQIEEINVQVTLNALNRKCVLNNKEHQNVCQLVIAFAVVPTLPASRTITLHNVSVHPAILSAIPMTSTKDVNKSTVFIISTVHRLNIVIAWTINVTIFACKIRAVRTQFA